MRRLSILLILPAVILGAGCTSDTGPTEANPPVSSPPPPPPPAPPPTPVINREVTRTQAQVVGIGGGSVSATSSAGIVYTLDIPPQALTEEVEIRITPVASMQHVPLASRVQAAVEFQPSGLRFREPAVLRMSVAPQVPDSMRLVGFSATGEGTDFGVELAQTRDGSTEVPVRHFSVAGAWLTTPEEIEADLGPVAAGSSAAAAAVRAIAAVGTGGSLQQYSEILRRWYVDGVRPFLSTADGNPSFDNTLEALLQYWDWWNLRSWLDVSAPVTMQSLNQALADLDADGRPRVARVLRALISQAMQACAQRNDLAPWLEADRYQSYYAVQLGVDGEEFQLDRSTFHRDACIRVVMEEDDIQLVSHLQKGFPHSMDADARGVFTSGFTRTGPMEYTVTGTQADIPAPQGFSDESGRYTTVVSSTGHGAVTLTVRACVVLVPSNPLVTDICTSRTVARRGVDLTGEWEGSFRSTIDPEDGRILQGAAELRVSLVQTQNRISGSYVASNQGAQLPGTVTATLTGIQLAGFRLEQGGFCPGAFNGPAFINEDGSAISATFTGASCTGWHTNGIIQLTRR